DKLEVESISAPDGSGLRTARVLLANGGQQLEATYLITPDAKEIIEGGQGTVSASPLSADPWASIRARLDLRGAPSAGPASAPVTIVEFSDLECPFCKQEASTLEQLQQQDPGKARILFKYFPLTNIHPWSMQAAEAAACVVEQNPAQFWNFEKGVFDAQEQINPQNAAQRLKDFATEAGAKPAAYDACLASPATQKLVEASIANGKLVGVQSTPTLFLNGRLIPGAVALEQLRLLVDHEATFPAAGAELPAPAGAQCGECKPLPKIKH
ncbi:MAG: thioredoxin domain-containing protein, partial [Terriglobales bacterium]